MKPPLLRAVLFGVATTLASGSALAQATVDSGKREYDSNCASCHGVTGAGDGPFQPYLGLKIPDLTTLAKRNNGVFPVARVHAVIDGRQDVKGHGPRTMPVWGADYLGKTSPSWPWTNMDVPYDPEIYVRGRIMALVDYLNRMQIK
jgi:mono/diheme cytochrome c family protein